MTFFYLTNFSYVKTVLTIWSVSQFAIFKNMHVFADPITYGELIGASNRSPIATHIHIITQVCVGDIKGLQQLLLGVCM